MTSANCIFCKIINKEIPNERVYEDKEVVAFKDIAPKAPIHLLLVPRTHIPSVAQISAVESKVLPALFLAAQKLADQLGFRERGYRAIFNSGRDSGMEVDHLHLHILAGGRLGKMG